MASLPVPGSGNGSGSGTGNPPLARPSGTLGDHLPPQNLEAERWLLGAILLDNDVLHEVAQFLTADDFYRDTHQIIYRAITDLYSLGKAVDAVTLADELTRRDQYKQIGGDELLLEISNSVPHAANAKYHAEIVRQKSICRQLIQSATEIIREGYSNLYTAQQLLEMAEQRIFTIAEDQVRGETHEIKQVLEKAMGLIAKRGEEKHPVTGVG
ncbi:MAG: replicative DNA helicase, partial [Planctomycetaceae bacterium]|nr:replicative DNA helicase [Planctomycetaceae bacterium]